MSNSTTTSIAGVSCSCPFRATLLGLDKLGTLLTKWSSDPSSYAPEDMKECLDSWRAVLFKHLDEEVSHPVVPIIIAHIADYLRI